MNPTNGEKLSEVNIDDNPTRNEFSLLIFDNFLSYGRYMMQIQVDIEVTAETKFQTEALTYVQINPSGMAVAALPGGTTKISVGFEQNVYLRPALYSRDFDKVISPSQLNYSFICQVL